MFAIDLVLELVRTGCAHGELERSGPGTVALSDRVQPAYQEILERNPGAVSDRGGAVRSRGERPPARAPKHREMT